MSSYNPLRSKAIGPFLIQDGWAFSPTPQSGCENALAEFSGPLCLPTRPPNHLLTSSSEVHRSPCHGASAANEPGRWLPSAASGCRCPPHPARCTPPRSSRVGRVKELDLGITSNLMAASNVEAMASNHDGLLL